MNKKIIVLLSLALTILTVISVISRKYFRPIIWSLDISRLIYMWLIFLSIYEALKNNGHLSIDYFLGVLKKRQKINLLNKIAILRQVSVFIFFLICAIFAFQFTAMYKSRNVSLISLPNFPLFLYPLAILVGSMVALLWLIRVKLKGGNNSK